MKKKYIFMFLFLSIFSFVSAVYVVNLFIITADVSEPFNVGYAIIENEDSFACSSYTGAWGNGADIDIGTIYAGERRQICARIENLGQGEVNYVLNGITTGGNITACGDAFGTPITYGTIDGADTIIDSLEIIVAGDSPVLTDCEFTVSLSRE